MYQDDPPPFRAAFELAHPHREAAGHVHAALRSWLSDAHDTFDADAFDAGLYDVDAGLAVLAESGRCPRGTLVHRWRVRDLDTATAAATVVLRTHEAGRAWLLVEGGVLPAPDPRRLVAAVVGRAEAWDGPARLSATPCAVTGDDDAAELVDAIQDVRRRLPLLLFTDPASRRRSDFEGRVAALAAQLVGEASMHTLMPRAAVRLRELTGFDVVRACGDDAVLVHLAPREGAGFGPDGELAADGGFTVEDLRAAAGSARFPHELAGLPTFLDTSSGGDVNLEDITVVRQMLREADDRALRAEARADNLAAELAQLQGPRVRS